MEPDSRLQQLLDTNLNKVALPSSGLMLTDHLAKILEVRPGDKITVEVLEGSRATREVTVVALVKQYLGVTGYMDLSSLNRLMNTGDAISGAYLSTDLNKQEKLFHTYLQIRYWFSIRR